MNISKKFLTIVFFSLLFIGVIPNINSEESNLTFNVSIENPPCFAYSIEVINYTTKEQISLTENFACKVVDVNASVVTVMQRWNSSGLETNDTTYSHYYYSLEDLSSIRGSFGTETKTYGGIEFTIINATSGKGMPNFYDWYVYDNETGIALEGYRTDVENDKITHSWLTFYSFDCDFSQASENDNGENDGGNEDDDGSDVNGEGAIPGYPLYSFFAIIIISVYNIARKRHLHE